jgi:hypothetical protein
VAEPLILLGYWNNAFCEQVGDLCLGVATGLDAGIF